MERVDLKALVLGTGSAVERGEFVFLRDPKWGPVEQAQFETMVQAVAVTQTGGGGWLCIPTGGTSGALRFVCHDEQTLGAAVRGFCEFFDVKKVNALDVLPPHHVSGLMARIRCAQTGGKRIGWSWKQLEVGDWPELPKEDDGWFLSLVPTQLQRLLGSGVAIGKLKQFRAVFIGGGPLWPDLAGAAAAAGVPVSICYGMTETAAMAVAQRPGAFWAGDRSCGQAMPHAQVQIVDETSEEVVPRGTVGLVRLSGESLFIGYWPEQVTGRTMLTEDLGRMDEIGRLTILGRRDAMIITGGKKVQPVEVETILRSSGTFDDIVVIGVPDPEWGQVVVACYTAGIEKLDMARIGSALETLAAYKRPKRYVVVSPWPRNAQGKISREALLAAVIAGSLEGDGNNV